MQRGKNGGTGRTRLTVLTAALGNGQIKTKIVTTRTIVKLTLYTTDSFYRAARNADAV